MSSDIAIKVEGLGKCYQIYDRPHDRLKQFILPRLQRLFGKTPKQYFREFWALKDISFEVKKGQMVGVIGRNGSGKSTLLQLICGTLSPTTGAITAHGRIAALLELGSGFNPEFTGRENVYINASVLGLTRQEIDQQFNDIVAFADIGAFIEQPIKTYSSGMMLRLAFAVIAHVDADILVIDEALSVGDAFFTQKCMRFLRDFMKHGTLLFVSHDTGVVVNLCNYAVLLQHGVIVRAGSPKEVAEKYLESLYQSMQGDVSRPAGTSVADAPANDSLDFRDMRQDFINTTSLRNDIEVFKFDPDAPSFGNGNGAITQVSLEDMQGNRLLWVVGGELVRLRITARLGVDLPNLLFGFSVKDRLGQYLFGDNSYLTYAAQPICGMAAEEWVACFDFRMPTMPAGEYSVDVALGGGTQIDHVIHHWTHGALVFKSHADSGHRGLIGIPMLDIAVAPSNHQEKVNKRA